jgi:predicted nucleic acid-binding protein
LDSNVVIEIYRGETKEIAEKLKDLQEQNVTITINSIILAELFKGAYLVPEKKEALAFIEEFVPSVEILAFTEQATRVYGQQYALLKRLGKRTQEFDLMIASICMAHNAILVTRNHKDFTNIKELKFVVW